MKCVKDKQIQALSRVRNEVAAKIVESDPKRYCYTTKNVWRRAQRKGKRYGNEAS